MNLFIKSSLLTWLMICSLVAWAQPQSTDLNTAKATMGKIVGQVIDKTSGETIPGAIITLEGLSKGARTDVEGRFIISEIQPGVYNVIVRYTSYEQKTIPGVEVTGKEPLTLNISLEEKKVITAKGTAVAKASYKKESVNTLLIQQKNAVAVSDGISIETIRKTPDRNTGDILKRVSGASLQDNKYAVIRGLPDRYNTAFINGSPLPSSEPDRKAFSLDIFPASMIDKLVILKTATPDLPAEWAGGIIQIQTRDIPDNNFYNLSLGAGFNSVTTFKPFYSNVKGKYDFIGIDDGTRALPKGIPGTTEFNKLQNAAYSTYSTTDPNPYQPAMNFVGMGKMFNNNYVLNQTASALPNFQGQFSMGQSFTLSKKKGIVLGSILALSYNNTRSYNQVIRQDFDESGRQNFIYNDDQYNNNTMAGALWNISLKVGSHSKFSLKNMYNINSTDQTILRNGADSSIGFDTKAYTMWFTQNQLLSNQFNGEHVLTKKKIKLSYGAGFSNLQRLVPDLRRVRYQRLFVTNPEDTQAVKYYVPMASTGNSDVAGRFFSTQKDHIYSGNIDIAIPFKAWGGRLRNELKVGYFGQMKDRSFDARLFGYTTTPVYQSTAGLNYLGPDQIFDPSNISFDVWGSRLDPADPNSFMVDSMKGAFQVNEITTGSDSYSASSILNAGYVRMDNQLWEKYRLIWGVRVEQYFQSLLTTPIGQNSLMGFDTSVVDVLPSANFIYSVNSKQNIRLGFSQTVSRPEFRELAPFAFFDFNENYMNIGSTGLLRTKITNYDARWECFPSGGQVISVSLFYKHFSNPIERTMLSAGNVRNVTFQNVPSATAYGVEIDFRSNIGGWLKKDKKHAVILDELFFVGNFSLIKSKVDLTGVSGVDEAVRPLQGQSPYLINGGLQYQNDKHNWGFSAMFNRYGRRITNVGFVEYPSIYEKSRNVFDVQISKTFFKHLDVRAAVRDIFANDGVFYQDVDKDKKFSGNDQVIWRYKYGRTFSLTLSYKF